MLKKAFVFPGQGSQSIGMLQNLAENFSEIRTTFELASTVVQYDIWELVQQGPVEKLNQTEHTQVAMLTADVAVYRALQAKGLGNCDMMAGHSLGEYAALVNSEALTLEDGVRLVAKRGQIMQESIPLGTGAMAAIVGLSDEQVREICDAVTSSDEQVIPANYNAIGQVVIAGHTAAVEKAIQAATEMDARLATIIPVSVPCHCPLLKDAANQFEQVLANTQFKAPKFDVISNVDLKVYTDADEIRERLKVQLYSPVRWVETIQLMKDSGIELIIEAGPGKVLTGLCKRIDRSLQSFAVNDLQGYEQIQTQLGTVVER